MNKYEFLNQLQDQLTGTVSAQEMNESVQYYRDYIEEQLQKGYTEEEILEELGSANSIAKSIIDASGSNPQFETIYDPEEDVREQTDSGRTSSGRVFQASGVSAVLILIGIILVIAFVIGVAFKLFAAIVPILLPLMIIFFVIRLINGRR